MSDLPVCQNCGKKLYKQYGGRGILATPNYKYHSTRFYSREERNNFQRNELPENAFDVDTWEYNNQFYNIAYSTPQQSRDGLFHSQSCFYQWHNNHRNEIERLIRDMGEWKNPS